MDLTDGKMDIPDVIVEDEIQKEQYMTFKCSDEIYGISIKYVNEIIGLSQITKVPETQDYLIGLINLRGKIIPVIDVRIRFGKEPLEYNDRTCVIVIDVKSTVIGLIVDAIDEVAAFAENEITPPPSVSDLAMQAKKYVFGIGRVNGEVKLLLDPDKLINDPEPEKDDEAEDETEEE
ncbi:cheW protein [Clostridium sp. CAG:122]|jgi:purine-binding chemotaxis protein CheW|uniref:chemotaxis protein CheW n=1 Tax=Clostridia TaxID=186801 RepID=UPI000335EFF6|nr:chemotaxis protein CheW [Clostridium sp. AM27-31LB]CCZ42722.1 cheW protein [Clostridium sp. CAG:122]